MIGHHLDVQATREGVAVVTFQELCNTEEPVGFGQ